MRNGAAFNFIPELLGDASHILELSANPTRLYVESAIKTLHMASNVIQAFTEHLNTVDKARLKRVTIEKYNKLELVKLENSINEEVLRLDNEYESIKIKIRDGEFRDRAVREFIGYIGDELKKVLDILNEMDSESDFSEQSKVEEIMRRTLRDYNKIITIYVEEDNNG